MHEQPDSQAKRPLLLPSAGGPASLALAVSTPKTSTVPRASSFESIQVTRAAPEVGTVPKGAEHRTAGRPVSRFELPLGNAALPLCISHFFLYFKLLTPTGNDRGPAFTEAMLKTLHAADHERRGVAFRIDSNKGETCLAVDVPSQLKSVVVHELQDSYPGLEAKRSSRPTSTDHSWTCELRKHPDVFQLRPFETFTDETNRREFADPLSGVLSAMQSGRSGRLSFGLELTFRPATKRRLKSADRIRQILTRGFRSEFAKRWFLRLVTSDVFFVRLVAHLIARFTRRQSGDAQNDSETGSESIFECHLVLHATAANNVAEIANKRLTEIAGAFARYNSTAQLRSRHKRKLCQRGFLLTSSELATLWHLPTKSTDSVVRVSRGDFRELEPPAALRNVSKDDSTVLGRVCFRNDKTLVRISTDDLRRHLIVVGKTGCGKSTFLLNVVRQQMEAGRGVILIDPHGQLAEEVLAAVPKRRKNDVINFDASNRVAPIGFNPLIGPVGSDPTLVADGVLTSFKNVFGLDAGSAPRLLHIFRNCLLSLIGTRHASLHSVQRMLVDAQFRKSAIAEVSNTAVREFWLTEFNRWNDRDRTQYIASLQNKLGAFTTNEHLNKILNPTKKGMVQREVMDDSKILICNLSKGTVGHDASKLLGSLLLSSLQIAAMIAAEVGLQSGEAVRMRLRRYKTKLAGLLRGSIA